MPPGAWNSEMETWLVVLVILLFVPATPQEPTFQPLQFSTLQPTCSLKINLLSPTYHKAIPRFQRVNTECNYSSVFLKSWKLSHSHTVLLHCPFPAPFLTSPSLLLALVVLLCPSACSFMALPFLKWQQPSGVLLFLWLRQSGSELREGVLRIFPALSWPQQNVSGVS